MTLASPEGPPPAGGRPPRRVRIIDFIRTAHLERLQQMAPADVLYLHRRYDFDESLVDPQHPPVQAGRAGIVLHLLRHPYAYAEINEPLLRPRWWDIAAQIVALRLRNRGANRTVIGAYCIGLRDPVASHRGRRRLPEPLDAAYCRAMLRFLIKGTDRLAFGTQASRRALERYVDPGLVGVRAHSFPAVPAACECLADHPAAPAEGSVVFVGAFDDRKGIHQLMQAWEAVEPDAAGRLMLHLVGKGKYLDEVTSWAASRPGVSLTVDPPRSDVHAAYREAAVLVLLSQRVGDWREQVGLPLVEAVSHGCTVVTTSETGIADWLAAHGHTVLDPALGAQQIAAAIVAAATAPRPRREVIADLPARDNRFAADDWLMGVTPLADAE